MSYVHRSYLTLVFGLVIVFLSLLAAGSRPGTASTSMLAPSLRIEPVPQPGPAAVESPQAIRYLNMHEVTRLRRDGSAEEELAWTIRNEGYWPIDSAALYIQTPTAEYSNVRTWDSNGPLDHTLVVSEGAINITVHFRHAVWPVSTYTYYLAIDLGDIAVQTGDSWEFQWRTGFPVDQFVRGVELPMGALASSISPDPDVQNGEYYEWTRSNIDEFIVSAIYQLRSLSAAELVERYKPYLRMHGEEVFTPMPVELALQHATEIRDIASLERETDVTPERISSAPWYTRHLSYIDFNGTPLAVPVNSSESYYLEHIRAQADLSPTVYARVYSDPSGSSTNIVLQYWLFYYYNSWFLEGGLNLHEGDWEMVQVVLDHDGLPLYAAYAQHAAIRIGGFVLSSGGTKKEWNDLHRVDTHPVVYVGLGSHASYFGPYSYVGWLDKTGEENTAPVIPEVVILPSDVNGHWGTYYGRWGQNLGPLNQGPQSPGRQLEKWSNPIHWGANVVPWDEESDHHIGKWRATADAPCNVAVTDRLTQRRYGWFYSTFYTEIDDGEYIVNETSGKRSLILHGSHLGEDSPRYAQEDVEVTCEQFPTPSVAPGEPDDPVTFTVQFEDVDNETIVTLTYELTEGWDPATSVARLDLDDGADFVLETDLNGDGMTDIYSDPILWDEQPVEEPRLLTPATYLPVITHR